MRKNQHFATIAVAGSHADEIDVVVRVAVVRAGLTDASMDGGFVSRRRRARATTKNGLKRHSV